ncbi:MAG TPA: RdgB/HAM1 family non-canonical purine NTP pyrophosphatase [Candidatus Omnitrophota bacterium]|nr:RdgB/HAM1 family non-canonical purine NTP pyrophosphatase [Candidatus Omnitrophota bacterium]
MSEPIRLLLATTNLKKLGELQDLLKGLPFRCFSLQDVPEAVDVEETGATFEENAKLKATGYAFQTGMLTLGEDSGICCDALNGAPGILSARFAGPEKNDEANNQKLLDLMKDVPAEKRTAHYESAIAIAEPDRLIGVVKGQVFGLIAKKPAGTGGFGYDPLFFFPEFNKTFAQVTPEMKHSVSHRGRAWAQALALLKEYLRDR